MIGETCHIGNNCYILQGVILGSKGVAGNPKGKRHPTIGNNVEIAAFVKVLGPVTIGDNVFISPNSIVTFDVENDAKILVVNQLQIQTGKAKKRSLKIYGILPIEGNCIKIIANRYKDPKVYFLMENSINGNSSLEKVKADTHLEDEHNLIVNLSSMNEKFKDKDKLLAAKLQLEDCNQIILLFDSMAVKEVMHN